MSTPVGPNHQHKIPAAWQNLRRFIFAKLVFNETTGKSDKLPCDYYGNVCSAHDPAKHLTPQELFGSPIFRDPRYHVAIVIAEGDGNWCIDLDQCFDAQGKLTPGAQSIVAMFPGAYVETSISGKGLHIFGRGAPPPHRTRAAGIELYSRARFILLAGINASGDPGLDFTAQLAAFVDTYALRLTAAELAAPAATVSDLPRPGTTGVFLTDAELIEVMRNSRGSGAAAFGEAVHPRDLWDGNAAEIARVLPQPGRSDGCPFDRTRAEGALIQHLMFYTGGHESRTLRLFEQSALWRPGVHDRQPYKLTRPVARAGSTLQRFYDRPVAVSSGPVAPGAAADGWEHARAVAAASWGVGGAVPPPAAPVALPAPVAASLLASMTPPDREWTVANLIPHRQVTLVSGDGGTGKTTILLQLALAAGCMTMWLGQFVTPRRVLFVSGEDEIEELHYRIAQTAKAMGVDASNVYVMTLEQLENTEIAAADRRGDRIKPTANFEHIKSVIQQFGISMVIFDPVADLFGGDEIDKRQVKQFIGLLRRELAGALGCTVVLSAHPSVDAMRSGRGYSGSTAWNNSVRSRLYFTAGEKDDDTRYLEHAKSNRSKKSAKIKVEWTKKGIFVPTDIQSISKTDVDALFMTILKKRMDLGLFVSPHHSKTFAPTVFASDENSQGVGKDDFERAMLRLKEAKMIDFIDTGPPSKIRTHIVPTAPLEVPTPTDPSPTNPSNTPSPL